MNKNIFKIQNNGSSPGGGGNWTPFNKFWIPDLESDG